MIWVDCRVKILRLGGPDNVCFDAEALGDGGAAL